MDTNAPLTVLDEGEHHVVVFKPADCVVVAGRGAPRPTLLDLVKERFGEAAQPVHRLDRVTTGACVFAKSKYGQQALSAAFRSHKVDKRYLALVEGEPRFDQLDVDARLLRVDDPKAKKGPLAWQTIDDEKGQRAKTQLKVLQRAGGHALILCQPQTGRMHQIRAHLAHVGHPIVGDALYGAVSPRPPDVADHLVFHQVGLHALAIAFPRPEGGRSFVVAPVDDGMAACAASAGLDTHKASAPVRESFEARAAAPPPPAAASARAPSQRSSSTAGASASKRSAGKRASPQGARAGRRSEGGPGSGKGSSGRGNSQSAGHGSKGNKSSKRGRPPRDASQTGGRKKPSKPRRR